MAMAEIIESRLNEAFAPRALEIVNDSSRHAGHAGDDGSGESHFTIHIVSDAFAGMSRLERHRAVHTALGDLTHRIHALALKIEA